MENTYRSVYKSEKHERKLIGLYDAALSNWPVPFEETFLETGCGRTHIIQCGTEMGKPLLLFHGTGNNSLMWRYNVGELGKSFRLFLINTINDPGKSAASAIFRAPAGYAGWISEVITGLNLKRVSLLGHSKGGWLALNSVINSPDRFEKLVLLAPAAGINAKLNPAFLLRSLSVGIAPTPKNITSYFEYMSGPGRKINMQYIDYLSSLIKGTRSRPVKHRQFTDDELKSVSIPVLLIFGDHEVSVDYRKVVERARSLIRDITISIVPDAGHGLQGENPGLVDRLIIDFLK